MGQCYTPRSLTSTLGLEIEHATSPGQEGGRFQSCAAAGLQHVEYARAVDPKRLKPRTLPVGLSVISCIPKWAERRRFLWTRLLKTPHSRHFFFFLAIHQEIRRPQACFSNATCARGETQQKKHMASDLLFFFFFKAISYFIIIIFNFVLQVCQYEVAQEQQTCRIGTVIINSESLTALLPL